MRCAMRMSRFLGFALVFLPALGCGRGGHYQVAPVSGRVTINSRPLAHAEIRFYPEDPEKHSGPIYSHAKTDEQGNYTLHTFVVDHEVNGGLVGQSRVEISLNERDLEKPKLKAAPRELVPAEFNNHSKLTCSVPPEGTSDANFGLKRRYAAQLLGRGAASCRRQDNALRQRTKARDTESNCDRISGHSARLVLRCRTAAVDPVGRHCRWSLSRPPRLWHVARESNPDVARAFELN